MSSPEFYPTPGRFYLTPQPPLRIIREGELTEGELDNFAQLYLGESGFPPLIWGD